MSLQAYLWDAAGRRFVWGEWDCLQGFVSEWLRLRRGGDPAAPWRGRYRTELGCARLLRRAGGLVALLERELDRLGLERTADPRVGDVGAVMAATPRGPAPAGAIRTEGGWAMLHPGGLMIARADPVASWRV